MKTGSPKYKDIKDQHYPNNGNLLNYYLTSNHINKTQLAKDLEILPATLYKYFRQQSLQFGILWKISKILNHNFAAHLGEYLEIPYETQAEKQLRRQLAHKEEQIRTLEIRLQVHEEQRMKNQS